MSGVILVDAHVHLYEGFDLARAFSSALRNFLSATPSTAETPVGSRFGLDLCLCLTEDRDHDVFASLDGLKGTRWSAEAHGDGRTIRVRDTESEAGLWLFAGRQIITAERLEVLALLVGPDQSQDLTDGETLEETVRRVHGVGALPVLPWAFGKWWFGRGQLVKQFVHSTRTPVFLGDNGGRWRGLAGLNPYQLGVRVGRPVLPGSDPLPLVGQEDRIARYGFSIKGTIDEDAPAESFHATLANLRQNPDSIGCTATLPEFLADQWKLRTARLPSPVNSR